MSNVSQTAPSRPHTDRPQIPVRRPGLEYPVDRARRWLHGRVTTLVAHALSPLFPAGERFFIKSVMAFADEVKDPQLRHEMRQFAAQEAVHTHEHQKYDETVDHHYPTAFLEAQTAEILDQLWERVSGTRRGRRFALAMTVALEHFTALLGEQSLEHIDIYDGVDPQFAELWTWHAAEEIEHKAVAIDVYRHIGGGELERMIVQATATGGILFAMFMNIAVCMARDGIVFQPRAWAEVLRFLFIDPGPLTKAVPHYLDAYKPGFHPWDHDNRDLIEKWEARYPRVAEARRQQRSAQ